MPGCSRQPAGEVRILAVVPFENLTGDTRFDWLGAAIPVLLERQLSASTTVRPVPVASISGAYAAGAAEVLEGYWAPGPGGSLALHGTLEDLGRLRSIRTFLVTGPPDGVLSSAGQLARGLDPSARPYPSQNLAAIRAFTLARADPGSSSARSLLEQAVAADPGYGPAWVALAGRLVESGEATAARQVMEQALAAKVSEDDRARLEALQAGLRGDEAGRERALAKLSELDRGDVNLLLHAAGSAYRERRYSEAAALYGKAAAASPRQPGTWNLLAYAQACAGDLAGAEASLEKYRQLAPGDPNRLDSLGDVHYLFGRFDEARKYYLEAAATSPRFLGGGPLHKAAEAEWMAGRQGEADALERRYLDARRAAADPLLPYREAQWKYLTGRQGEAAAALEAAVGSMSGDAAALARAELAAWRLEGGDPAGARRQSAASLELTANPQIRLLALMSQAAALDGDRGRMEQFVRQAVPGEAARDQALGWALLFRGLFAEAEPFVAAVERHAPPDAAGQTGVLRAWTLVRAGKVNDAASFTERYPLPSASGEGPLSVLVTPRWFFVRAMVLRQRGRSTEAAALIGRYRQYAGYSRFAREDLAQWGGP